MVYYFYGFSFLGTHIKADDDKEEVFTSKTEIENLVKDLLYYFYEQIYNVLQDPSATYEKVCEKFNITAYVKVVGDINTLNNTYILEYDHNLNIINKFYEKSKIIN